MDTLTSLAEFRFRTRSRSTSKKLYITYNLGFCEPTDVIEAVYKDKLSL
jgi:hypothetical protein